MNVVSFLTLDRLASMTSGCVGRLCEPVKSWSAILLGVATFAATGIPAQAQDWRLQSKRYYTEWYIEPGKLTDPAGPISQGRPIFHAKLFPGKLYTLRGAVALPQFETTLAEATQLVGVNARIPVGCTFNRVKKAGTINVIRTHQTRVCLADSDRDGNFDGYFLAGSYRSDLLIAEGELPDSFEPIQPAAFAELDPRTIAEARYLYLFYAANHSFVGKFSLGFEISNEPDQKSYRNSIWYGFKDSELPARDKLMGVDLTILSKGKGGITIKFNSADPRFLAFRGAHSFVPVPMGVIGSL